jgi:hypothetical protein
MRPEAIMRHNSASSTAPDRVLLVADWNVDPQAVVDAIRSQPPAATLALLVPAKLNGLDWVGDPYASVPCAQRQLDRIIELAHHAGLTFAAAAVGDPEPLAAICDALADCPAERLVLFARGGRLSAPHPFDLFTRARRLTGLEAVERIELPAAARPARRRTWLPLRSGHCTLQQPQSA